MGSATRNTGNGKRYLEKENSTLEFRDYSERFHQRTRKELDDSGQIEQ